MASQYGLIMPLPLRSHGAAVALAITSVLAVGCAETPLLPENADAELVMGQDVYTAKCSRCHGASGAGGLGSSIRDISERLTEAEQIAVVSEGRNSMPRFDGVLTNEEIAAVMRYVREFM